MPPHEFDVAVVGDNTIDRYLDEPDLGDLVGGNALNVAVQLAMLGVSVRYFGAVGTDHDAEVVRAAVRARGLDTTSIAALDGATALTTIRRRGGDRVFESEDFGVTVEYYPDPASIEQIRQARWVHIGMLPGAARLGRQLAEHSQATVSQDCSVSPDRAALGVSFASAGEDPDLAERVIVEHLDAGSRIAVATLGAGGAVAGRGARRWRMSPPPTDVVDTTGAGDSFMAGFIAARLRGGSVEDALDSGVRRGSFTCGFVGGWPQLAHDVARFG